VTPGTVVALLAWGTLVGVDLVSVPQIMIARPLVAATVAGWILGDPVTGVTVGAVLELFALEVLPVGAARYPDYGPAGVAAAVAAAGNDVLRGIGLAVAVGLVVAYVGELAIQQLRRVNSGVIQRRAIEIDSGDVRVIRAVQFSGVARDAVRAALLTGFGLVVGGLARSWPPLGANGVALLDAVLLGAGIASAAAGAVRGAGAHGGVRWVTVGVAAGSIVAVSLR